MFGRVKSLDAAFTDFFGAQLCLEIGDSACGRAPHDLTVSNVEIVSIDGILVIKKRFVAFHGYLPNDGMWVDYLCTVSPAQEAISERRTCFGASMWVFHYYARRACRAIGE